MAAVLDIPIQHGRYLFLSGTPYPWGFGSIDGAKLGFRVAPGDDANAAEVAAHIERYVTLRGWALP